MRPAQLWPLLARWRGYTYGALDTDLRRVDCCGLTASVLRDHYGVEVVTPAVWADLCLSRPVHRGRPWAPVESIAEATGGDPSLPLHGPSRPAPGAVHLCQGWRGLRMDGIGAQSHGHAWFWISLGGWDGVCIESSGRGPRVWDGYGRRDLDEVVASDGRLVAPLAPMDWSRRAGKWTDGVAWAVLP